ncbi:alanine racemase [Kytococcus aerolatus]|uniref:Alanine racemase n=1 Tax=Kytococcus aerolatus TaxID=592308 RepID=A0A212TZ47_9MICO|nr:alanine racemase [Kytococcus aerolatus]SNC71273.1 alanine racemase [Kytococcus aerolatus]
MDQTRSLSPIRAEVDTTAITANIRRCGELAGGAAVMGVVKAGGYGHGALTAARAALEGGAALLGLAQPVEAIALKRELPHAEVLAWLLTPDTDLDAAVAAELTLGVAAPWALDAVEAAAERSGRTVRVHLEVDTGMCRAGVAPEEWPAVVARARRAEEAGTLRVEGIFSHLACADEPGHPATDAQRERFEAALADATEAGLRPRWRHLANSAAVATRPDLAYDLVRPGLMTYGISPVPDQHDAAALGLRPALRWEAQLSTVRRVPAGSGVSYGHTHVVPTDRWLGVVPLGYGDGVPRSASDRAQVAVHTSTGTLLAHVAGRVCMDQFVVDLGPAAQGTAPAAAGDRVTLVGDPVRGEPGVEDWAAWTDTISYEVVTRIGPRVPRTGPGGAPLDGRGTRRAAG